MKLPTISVCIATYNSAKTLDQCLRLVREQDYPQEKIEIILGDGGSTDKTKEIAKKYQAKVVAIPADKQHAEYNRGVAFNKATGELALILDHDNFMPHQQWLKKMVQPFLDFPKMVATESCYYHYDRSYTMMDRYFALLGTSEPLPFYLGKADRMPQFSKDWSLSGKSKDQGEYFVVEFSKDPRQIPSIGTNGCMMRRQLILDNAQADPDHHYPIDVMVDVIKSGHNQFGFIKDSIIHLTNARGFWDFINRRKRFVEHYHFADQQKRRWSVVMPGDELGVLLYTIISLTVIIPLIDSVRWFIKKPDLAWFVHPLMCFVTTVLYIPIVLRHRQLGVKNG